VFTQEGSGFQWWPILTFLHLFFLSLGGASGEERRKGEGGEIFLAERKGKIIQGGLLLPHFHFLRVQPAGLHALSGGQRTRTGKKGKEERGRRGSSVLGRLTEQVDPVKVTTTATALSRRT